MITVRHQVITGFPNFPSEALIQMEMRKAMGVGAARVQELARENVAKNFLPPDGERDPDNQGLAESIQVATDDANLKAAIGVPLTVYAARYAAVQELGAHIEAVNGPYLVFRTRDGIWHSVPEVDIPARPYLRPAMDAAMPEIVADIKASLGLLFYARGGE